MLINEKKPKIREIILVEGKYDKITLSSYVDAEIIVCSGFGIFNDEKKRKYISNLAEQRGAIIFTDSDSAGFQIRNYIKGFIPSGQIKNAFSPVIEGKEKRKDAPGKEGILGVEGLNREAVIKALEDCGATILREGESSITTRANLTKADFYKYGLTGRPDSAEKRINLIRRINLPEYISTNDLISFINIRYTLEEFEKLLKE